MAPSNAPAPAHITEVSHDGDREYEECIEDCPACALCDRCGAPKGHEPWCEDAQ